MLDPRKKTVVGIGELLWDCFGELRRPGGAPANVAFHVSQLGLNGMICSRVGSDTLGDALLQHLRGQGLEIQYIQRDTEHPTGTVTVETTRVDQPSYRIHENVAWDHLEFDGRLSDLLENASAICFGTLAQRSPQSRSTVLRALDATRSALRVYDVNLRPPYYTQQTIEASLQLADVVKLNSGEVALVASMLGLDPDDAQGLSDTLRMSYGVELVCITRGQHGCLTISEEEQVDVPGRQVNVVDTVGAGDSFTAALVYGLLNGWPLERIVHVANEIGALVASRTGAMPVLREEFAALLSTR
ncbi:MAG: carbohydrate kinase [Phycisphaerales bacterium]|nr:MAG: carbohydrate kinase [Phycisphaerales bacterium]